MKTVLPLLAALTVVLAIQGCDTTNQVDTEISPIETQYVEVDIDLLRQASELDSARVEKRDIRIEFASHDSPTRRFKSVDDLTAMGRAVQTLAEKGDRTLTIHENLKPYTAYTMFLPAADLHFFDGKGHIIVGDSLYALAGSSLKVTHVESGTTVERPLQSDEYIEENSPSHGAMASPPDKNGNGSIRSILSGQSILGSRDYQRCVGYLGYLRYDFVDQFNTYHYLFVYNYNDWLGRPYAKGTTYVVLFEPSQSAECYRQDDGDSGDNDKYNNPPTGTFKPTLTQFRPYEGQLRLRMLYDAGQGQTEDDEWSYSSNDIEDAVQRKRGTPYGAISEFYLGTGAPPVSTLIIPRK